MYWPYEPPWRPFAALSAAYRSAIAAWTPVGSDRNGVPLSSRSACSTTAIAQRSRKPTRYERDERVLGSCGIRPPGPLIRPPPGRWPVSTSTTPTLRIRTEVLQTDGPKSLPGRRRFLGRTGKHSHNWPSSYSSPRVRVPLANTICGRICAGGSGRGFQGTWQVGFESAAACFEPLLASWICRWRAHSGLVIKRAHVGAHLSPRGARMEPYEIQAARRSYRW